MHCFNKKIDDNAEKEKVETEDEEENVVDEKEDGEDDASGSDNDVDSDEENFGNSDDEDEDGETDDSNEEHGPKQTLQTKKPQKLSDVKEGKTLFIRNLSFDSTEEALHELFEQFGEIDYCKLMEDKQTGHSRGMAFVKFIAVESAEQCLAEATKEGSGKKTSVDQG